MTYTLGIHIGEDTIAAALASGDPIKPREIPLGLTGPTTAAAVAAGPDGAVLVGDVARDASGPIVTDPLVRAARGRTGALTAVITHVVGRAATLVGEAPRRLAIVAPDDYAAVERDNIIAAANAAGYTDAVIVPESLANARGSGGDGVGTAVGAALVGSFDAPPPLVTREDLGQAIEPTEPPPAAPPEPDGPVSVFNEDPEPALPPIREAPEPVAAPSPTPARPRPATPAPAPAAMVSPPPLQPIPERSFPLGLILTAVAAAVIAGVVLVLTLGGNGTETTAPSTTTSPVASSSTTEAPTTTVEPTSSTSSSTSTTSSTTSSTSTSSTSTTTTTTTPVRVATPGPVTLGETGLQLDTGTLVRFGQAESTVLDAISGVLGEPDSDSGRVENDFCAGPTVRFVRWGNLETVFTTDDFDDPDAVLTFTQWFADGHLEPTGLVTPEGLGESATVGFLEVTFQGAFVIVPAFEDDVVGIFAVTNPQTGGVLNGTTLGLDPEGVVTSLWAGDSCTRVFT